MKQPDIRRCVARGMRRLRKLRRLAILAMLRVAGAQPTTASTASRPHLLLVVVDDWDWSSWPSRGAAYARLLPNLDANFVQNGLSLSRHYTFFTRADGRSAR